MHYTREILRQKLAMGRSHREVARSLGVSVGVVTKVLQRAGRAGLDWAAAAELCEDALERLLACEPGVDGAEHTPRPLPDFSGLHTERRRKGVTLALLHEEYLAEHPDGYRYTQFCAHYRAWVKRRRLSMRVEHFAGDKCFVDYSGVRPHLVDPETGECTPVELFVAVLGASNYTYAEATATQRGPDFIASNVRALEYFGGVPAALVPDQLKSAVARSCRYDPTIQRTYEEMASHYGTTVMPARPRKPKDKAKVEVAVQIAQRWILARLRRETFKSLADMNRRIRALLEDLNSRVMRRYRVSRRALFERIDKAALRPLPSGRFAFFEWKRAKVNIDYHVDLDGHAYSVPHTIVHQERPEVELRYTATTVVIYLRGRRLATHARSYKRGGHTTIKEHMPKSHQKHMEWSPSRLIAWARESGPRTAALVEAILRERKHPEQGYRTCLGILRLGKKHGRERLEAACARAFAYGARSYRHVASILDKGLDRQPDPNTTPERTTSAAHDNIRGPASYH